jgi:hypothetical protein
MINVHKGLIFALPILLAPPAIAQTNDVMWKPSPYLGNAGGKACKDVCSNQGLVGVYSGVYSKTSPPAAYFVCRTNAPPAGTRPGYQVQTNPLVPPSTCTVGWRDKEETSDKYECLCTTCIGGPPQCKY